MPLWHAQADTIGTQVTVVEESRAPIRQGPTIIQLGIIGLPKVGKTTLFNTLTSLERETGKFSVSREANVGVAKIADPRLEGLRELFSPRRFSPATVEYVDLPGFRKFAGASSERPTRPLAPRRSPVQRRESIFGSMDFLPVDGLHKSSPTTRPRARRARSTTRPRSASPRTRKGRSMAPAPGQGQAE